MFVRPQLTVYSGVQSVCDGEKTSSRLPTTYNKFSRSR